MKAPKFVNRKITARLTLLRKIIGHTNWFISGSFANADVACPLNINIYFYTNKDYLSAHLNITNPTIHPPIFMLSTDCFIHNGYAPESEVLNEVIIHFTSIIYGTPKEVFNSFDLNTCKKAITSEGSYIQDYSASNLITITQVHSNTFSRFMCYLKNTTSYTKEEKIAVGNLLIDKYIRDTTPIDCYYNENISYLTCMLLYTVMREYPEFKKYLNKQAMFYIPELLL